MTYCLGIKLNQQIIMMSDSRTSAGVDNISTYSKMWTYGVPGERQFVLCSAGNLATTQAVIKILMRDIADTNAESLLSVNSVDEASEYVGRVSVECQKKNTGGGPVFESTFLLAGEVLGSDSGLNLIYSQGNYISCSSLVPFLQIGETKYGKPILDRVIKSAMPVNRAVLAGLVSMDATIKSNLTVGPPIELTVIEIGSLQPGKHLIFEEHNEYMNMLRETWNTLMQQAFDKMQPPSWSG